MLKNALFVFNGDPICFVHVLLNALDMRGRGDDVKIIVEGAATQLIPKLAQKDNPLNSLWLKVVDAGIVEGVCKACSQKMGTAEAAQQAGFALLDDMTGHPGMGRFQEGGYNIITF